MAGILAIFLVLICLFYLSFTYVSNSHEDKAVEYAVKKSGDKNQSSQNYRDAYKFYFDSIANKPVWLGYTQKEAQKLSIGLGLDLKGGMNVTLQLSIPDILKSMAGENANATLTKVINATDSVIAKTKSNDYVGTFIAESQKVNPKLDIAVMFRDVIKQGTPASQYESILKQEVKDRVSSSANVLRQRIDQFGVVSPNIQELEKDGQILLELPGVTDHERMEELLKASANLEFFVVQPVQNYQAEFTQYDAEVKARDGKGLMEHFAMGEVVRADIGDLRTAGNSTVLYLQGKGREEKTEFIKVTAPVEKAIRAYLKLRKETDPAAPLFASLSRNSAGERMTTRSISGIVKKRLQGAGFDSDRLTAHSLRHTSVTLALLAGKDITEVQQFARHSNISTTMIYSHHLDKAKNSCGEAITDAIF